MLSVVEALDGHSIVKKLVSMVNSKEFRIDKPQTNIDVEILSLGGLNDYEKDLATSFFAYDGSFDTGLITKVLGRNIYIQTKPEGIFYDGLQISGGGYVKTGLTANTGSSVFMSEMLDQNRLIVPPRADCGIFEHYTTVVQNGCLTEILETSPLGSYNEQNANTKYDNTLNILQLARGSDFLFAPPIPELFVLFKNIPDTRGGRQCALVFHSPVQKCRVEDFIPEILAAVSVIDMNRRSNVLEQYYSKVIFPTLYLAGKTARYLHDQNLCHYQMTLGNMGIIEIIKGSVTINSLYLADWETLMPIDSQNPLLARALELSLIFQSAYDVTKFLIRESGLEPALGVDIIWYSLVNIFAGYADILPEQMAGFIQINKQTIHEQQQINKWLIPVIKRDFLPALFAGKFKI
ncbi:hypothetical protein A2154_04670 [Candidatus Gottesmanbacteria bacterium RBG_16_43_7]|uniref:Uncharacterized protein n=1 Tax=Candidatus Gottesmanbacteria bacterium RBG_16_43_7 TaxID=1798373 RepID=A0A1F5Z7N1_9BACT|nr:MAG: hypothetical protein A2154_04670 [Candidatus Gottesmanbacteria bacterium RBG_16_43_7]